MATSRAPSPGSARSWWSWAATEVPARTGDTEAASVAGLAASHVTRAGLGRAGMGRGSSGSPWEACKVWFALLNVCVTALLGLLAQVVEQRRVPGQLLDAGQTIVCCVHSRLDHSQCQRAVLEHLARPGQGLLCEPFQRDHLVDESHLQRLLSVVLLAYKPDLARLLLANDSGEQSRAVAPIEATHTRACLAEPGVVGGDGQVADDVQDVTAPDCVAGDHRDDRLGGAPDLDLEVEDVEPADATFVPVAVVTPDPLVTPRAEGLGAGAGQDDDADAWVVPSDVERVAELEQRPGTEGVANVGAIDCDPGDPVDRVVPD